MTTLVPFIFWNTVPGISLVGAHLWIQILWCFPIQRRIAHRLFSRRPKPTYSAKLPVLPTSSI